MVSTGLKTSCNTNSSYGKQILMREYSDLTTNMKINIIITTVTTKLLSIFDFKLIVSL